MSRKYVKIDEYGKQILEVKAQRETNREITQMLGVNRKCIKNWIPRYNRQQRKLEAGILPSMPRCGNSSVSSNAFTGTSRNPLRKPTR